MAYQEYEQTPDFVLERAKEEHDRAETLYKQAKARIPEKYHDFLMRLEQGVKLFSKNMIGNDKKARELRLWGTDKGTYVTISLPYVTVDGRVQMARDEHRKAGKKLNILPAEISDNGKYLSVTVESELLGSATGSVMINVGGKGVDRTNPLENAETSAVGRALSFLGYGLVGTGIASAEEIENAKKAQNELNKKEKSDSDNVVDFKQKDNQSSTQKDESELKPNSQFVDMKAIATKAGDPCYELIFKAGEREAKVYAIGDMFDYIDQVAESLVENAHCYIETEKKEGKLVLQELKVVHSA
ncbi:hypothetical protein [Novibacillus thermophilus]|uniref:Uncharacterized protein n=1 Tax=Novibacillus thermophilus TaxID=1471761 RepID=A0A1U9K6P4_9BACL|nr:hypothetical protein [Novibacillus thermophilus]AQS55683.1 hypothetical protein B0W44_07660 [Novibacillus thermophilus]